MTLQEVINIVNELEPNTYTDERLTSFVNEVEMSLIKLTNEPTSYYEFKIEKNKTDYDLPVSVLERNIKNVFNKDVRLNHVGMDHDEEMPGYRFKEGKVQIFPIVNEDSKEKNIKIIYQVEQERLDYATDKDINLVAYTPFDEIYQLYAIAKVNFYNKDYAAYNNLIDQYNDVLDKYKNEIIRNGPTDKQINKFKNFW